MKRGTQWLAKGAELLAAEAEREEDGQQKRRANRRHRDELRAADARAEAASAQPSGQRARTVRLEDRQAVVEKAIDVFVVGSGYGGAVAAARIAEECHGERGRRLRVVVLERGLEYLPGDFPRTLDEMVPHVRFSGGRQPGVSGLRDGLFDLRLGDDVTALVANGLGGGSLVNAGVAERADAPTLADAAWPAPWRDDRQRWNQLYGRAETALAALPWRDAGLGKEAAMQRLARSLGAAEAKAVRLTIQPAGSASSAAGRDTPPLNPCLLCGDCFSGCNEGAKRTLSTTYLKRAFLCGVELYTGGTVLSVERSRESEGDVWLVHWAFTDPKRLPGRKEPFTLRATRVVLAAGTFGSTEILLRSQRPGLRFSAQLGAGFSANADMIGAQVGLPADADPYADEALKRGERKVGPTITRQIEIGRGHADPARRLVVQDLTAPAPLAWFYGELLTSLMLPQRWSRFDFARRGERSADRASVDDAALKRSLLVTAFGHDGAGGRLQPLPGFDECGHDGNLVVHWPGAGSAACYATHYETLRRATPKPAYWLHNPLWKATPESPLLEPPRTRQVVTVHPLGGCRMAENSADGVVDAYGRVFDLGALAQGVTPGGKGAAWVSREDRRIHDGLYVLDGSIVPTSLGINPLLTITALAEGIVDEWVVDWKAQRAAAEPAPARPLELPAWPLSQSVADAWTATRPEPTELGFSERMTGLLAPAHQPPDRPGAAAHAKRPLRLNARFDFGPITDVQRFLRGGVKRLPFEASVELAVSAWDAKAGRWRDAPPTPQPPGGAEEVRASGSVVWFEQPRSGVLARAWRALRGWWQLRRKADLPTVGACGEPLPRLWRTPSRWAPTLRKAWHFAKALTHFGAPRLLRYELQLRPGGPDLCIAPSGAPALRLPAGTWLHGSKELVYRPGANPWAQLTEIDLRLHTPRGEVLARLFYDELFMLGRDNLPLEVRRQHDGVTGLRDLASLALYFARVVFEQHFLSFRKPDYAPPRPLRRLPQPWSHEEQATRFAGLVLEPRILAVVTAPQSGGEQPRRDIAQNPDPHGESDAQDTKSKSGTYDPPAARPARRNELGIRLQLARVRPAGQQPDKRRTPVLLLHGLGSAGVQFLHPGIRHPIAQSLARRGHDVWVGELRTSIGLPTHRQQWVMDDIAREDIRALVDTVLAETGAAQVDVVAHCIGSAMFCMAVLGGWLVRDGAVQDGRAPSLIRRAVLLQVGPVVHLPRGNRMRGYTGNRLQKLLGLAMAESTVDDTASDGDVAVDRVLGTFPFMAGPGEPRWLGREREPGVGLTGNLRSNGRLANAFRSAGVFAQLFQWPNLADHPDTLAALPDLLGGCNLTTYQQTVHYTFLRRLTNQDGSGAYVTDANLRRHMHFPIRFIQGKRNDVFAPRGTRESVQLLRRVNGGHQHVDRKVIRGHGHLDVVVGAHVEEQVLPHIAGFLGADALAPGLAVGATVPPGAAVPSFRAPSVGPWIGDVRAPDADRLSLRIALRLDEQRATSQCVATLLVVDGRPLPQTLTLHTLQAAAPPLPPHIRPAVAAWDEGETIVDVHIADAMWRGAADGIEILVCSPDFALAQPLGAGLSPDRQAEFTRLWLAARDGRLANPPRSRVDLSIDSVVLGRRWLAGHADPATLSFVFGACRQAPLLTDRKLADAAMRRLCDRASICVQPPAQAPWFARPGAETPPHHLLLVGDQIYADALAGSGAVDGTRQRFFEAYREAWTADGQRAAMRRLPVYMASDDHEFRDNGSRATQQAHGGEWAAARMAMWRYQYAAGPAGAAVLAATPAGDIHIDDGRNRWYAFSPCGFPTFVADTRNEREDGQRVDRDGAAIMSRRQFAAIRRWLKASKQTGRPRFLVLPTPIAPFFRSTRPEVAYGLRCDDWQRYPKSLELLFRLLVRDGAERLCVLGGDYHCFADCLVTVGRRRAGRARVTFRSVTTGGLYCPYDFANTVREELWEPDPPHRLLLGKLHWAYRIKAFGQGAGHTRIEARAGDGAHDLDIAWVAAG